MSSYSAPMRFDHPDLRAMLGSWILDSARGPIVNLASRYVRVTVEEIDPTVVERETADILSSNRKSTGRGHCA